MTIYAYDTVQYLDAKDAPDGAGWYLVKANQPATKKNAATPVEKAPNGDVPIIMNEAAEDQPKPYVMEGQPNIYQIEKDFSPKFMHVFEEAITEADDNSVLRFGEGVEIVSVKKGSVNLPNADGTRLKMKTSKMELKSEDGDSYFIYVNSAAEKFSYQTADGDVMSLDAFYDLWKDGGISGEGPTVPEAEPEAESTPQAPSAPEGSYAYDTVQYLDAKDAPDGAGWYLVKANQPATKKNAATPVEKAPNGDVPIIMNEAAEDQPKPYVMEGQPNIYQIEKDFSPKSMYLFQEAITEADDNSILRFGEGVEIVSVKKGSVNLPNADGTRLKMKTSKMELKSEDGDSYFIYVNSAAEKFSYQTADGDVMSLDAFYDLWKDGGISGEGPRVIIRNETINGDDDANVIDGNGGTDMIDGRGGNDTITIERGEAHGGEGNDTIYSNAAKVYGGKGNDVIHMKNDISYGGDGNDTIYYERGEANGGDGNDVIQASTASSNAAAVLNGGAGDDTLSADGRNSTLQGGKGADVMHGGSGVDTLSYSQSDAGVYVNLTNGKAKGGDATDDSFTGIENIMGSDHDDNLRGDSGVNKIFGGKGNDIIAGANGGDVLHGGEGEDTLDYHYSSEGVKVDLSVQESYISYAGLGEDAGGQASGDVIKGFENVRGSGHDDILTGSSDAFRNGKKTVDGDNKLYGGKGNDTLIGSGGSDLLDGGKGVDTVSYEKAAAGVHVDLSTGQGSQGQAAGDSYVSIENLTGSDHDDVLAGDDGVNVINAGKGDDVVMAKADGDTITLGVGSDVVDFTAVDSLADISADIITDFTQGEDSIKLSQSLLGETGSVTATVTENDGVTGLALSVTTMTGGVATSVNFAFLEGVSEISQSDFEGDFVPSIDVV